jgi:DNA-binding response OmpR family regulator
MDKRILVIDDEAAIRKAFLLALEDTGYRVDTADSGPQGVVLARRHRYGLVFLDLKMPGMNGVETLRELKRIDNEVPIYIVTAFYAEYFDELKGAEEEGLDFELLTKPVDGDGIRLIVRSVFEGPQRF